MAKQPQILNLDDILAEEAPRFVIWNGKQYSIVGATGEAYLKFLSRQAQINSAIESEDVEKQWVHSLELIKLLAPGLPLDEMQKLPMTVFQKVVEFVMATFQESASGETSADAGTDSSGE